MSLPLFQTDPVEMGMNKDLLEYRLNENETYRRLFSRAFPDETVSITTENAIEAISNFVSTITSGNSTYDKWLLGEEDLEPMVEQGMNLFYSEELQCSACHGGLFFDQPSPELTHISTRHGYFNTGQYNIDGDGSYPANAQGLIGSTGNPEDMGRFRTPTLRNLSYTYPWMHDGTQISLEHIIKAYARGGRVIESGTFQGDGSLNPYKSDLISGFSITDDEILALVAFLESLHDDDLIIDSRWQSPFCMERDGMIINTPCEDPFQFN